MENKTYLSEFLESIEQEKIELTKEQAEQLKNILHKPIYNDNWDKLKKEFKPEFEKFNYTKNNKTVICSLTLQETVSTLLRIKYKVKNVREIEEPYNSIKTFTNQILELIKKEL